MRTPLTLGVLQTIGIVVLIVLALRDDDRAPEPISHLTGRIDTTTLLADEARLRDVIRQELARLQARPDARVSPSPPIAVQPRDEAADRHRQEQVAQQIETYRAAGSITREQMHELQARMVQLDAASRKQMISRLVQALNSGEIKGPL